MAVAEYSGCWLAVKKSFAVVPLLLVGLMVGKLGAVVTGKSGVETLNIVIVLVVMCLIEVLEVLVVVVVIVVTCSIVIIAVVAIVVA